MISSRIEVCPTSHFHMGGVRIDADCQTGVEGLFVAGEDAGGVHGSNRLGGNGVAESTVFGARAGDAIAAWVEGRPRPLTTAAQEREHIDRATRYLDRDRGGNVFALRRELGDAMWEGAGVVRDRSGLTATLERLADLRGRLARVGVGGGPKSNLAWGEARSLESRLLVGEALTRSALERTESRGAHRRGDYPDQDDTRWIKNVCLRRGADGQMSSSMEPVALDRLTTGPERPLTETG